jgi:hypothetical protein
MYIGSLNASRRELSEKYRVRRAAGKPRAARGSGVGLSRSYGRRRKQHALGELGNSEPVTEIAALKIKEASRHGVGITLVYTTNTIKYWSTSRAFRESERREDNKM